MLALIQIATITEEQKIDFYDEKYMTWEAVEVINDWVQLYATLPTGVHMVAIYATRSYGDSSGLAIDDVTISQCNTFGSLLFSVYIVG